MTPLTLSPTDTKKREREGLRDMVVATVFFSFMGVFVKLAGRTIDSQQIVLARNAFALVVTYWALKQAGVSPWGQHKRLLLVRGLFGFLGLTCFFYALTHLPLGDATVIHFMNPVLTGAIAAIFLKEHADRRTWLGGVVSLVGVGVMTRPSFLFGAGRLPLGPVLVALAGALFAAAAYVTVRQLRKTEVPLVVVFYFPLVAFPASIPTAYAQLTWPTPYEWLLLLLVGIMTQGGQVFLTHGLHKASAAKATSVSYLQVVLAFIWGVLLFGERPDALSGVGALLIVIGTWIASGRRARG